MDGWMHAWMGGNVFVSFRLWRDGLKSYSGYDTCRTYFDSVV